MCSSDPSYPGQASFPVTVRNLGKAPIYWPRLDAAVTLAQQERKFNVFISEPEQGTARLEPGAEMEFTAILVPRSDYKNPTGFAERIKFTATGLNCEPVKSWIAAEFQTPELHFESIVFDNQADSPSLTLTVINRGKSPLSSPEVTIRLIPATSDAKDKEDTLAAMPLELASGATRTFSLSLRDEAMIRRLRESPDTAQWSVSIDQYDPAPHCWISPPTPIHR